MKREDKGKIIEDLTVQLNEAKNFYLTDISDLTANEVSALRRKCFKENVQLLVVKNTLLRKALEKSDGQYDEVYKYLKGHTSVMLAETNNVPAKLIKEFRRDHKKPLLKAAYIEQSIYAGDSQLGALINIKSKEELLGDVIALLQSPMRNVISSLQSGANILHGVLKTLSERTE
jgi:large subunit ribosomal protein L10